MALLNVQKSRKVDPVKASLLKTPPPLVGGIFFFGKIGCLEENTKIDIIENGEVFEKRISELPERFKVLAYDFRGERKKKIIKTDALKIYSGFKEVFEIEFYNGKKVQATENHLFFDRNGEEVKVADLKRGDVLFGRTRPVLQRNVTKKKSVRKKLSKLKSGTNHHMYGKNHTEEAKKRMSKTHRGMINVMNYPNVRRKHSEKAKVVGKLNRQREILKGDKNPAFKHGKFVGQRDNREIYIKVAKNNLEWICKKCGKEKTNKNFDLVVHHIDGNNKNNSPDNLMILCQGCHLKIHRKHIK